MPDAWVIVGYVLLPLGFGLVPGFLPRRVPSAARWGLWLALLVASALYVRSLQGEPDPFPWLVLVPFWLSSLLSLYLLIVQTGRNARTGAPATRVRP